MDVMALENYLQGVHAVTRRSRWSSEISSKGKFSRICIVQAARAHLYRLGVLALLLTFPWKCIVGATTFAKNGFKNDDVFLVGDSSWIYNSDAMSFDFNPPAASASTSVAGRFLYPGITRMKDPGTTTVKSFSTSFIYELQVPSGSFTKGPGLAFIMVPDNVTVGATEDYMGIITADAPDKPKNYDSDNFTFAVELDTNLNPEFNDLNDNHIGVNLASMNSTHSITLLDLQLAEERPAFYLPMCKQVWIDYFKFNSTMNIYFGTYGLGKPTTPQGSQMLTDLSFMKEDMYIGFSTSKGEAGNNIASVYAWSFSNDGILAPPVFVGQDAPISIWSPPPPNAPPPDLGPPATPPSPSLAPPTSSPESSAPSPPTNPPPVKPPLPLYPPSQSPSIAPQSPSSEPAAPPAGGRDGRNPWKTFGVPIIIFVAVVCIPCSLCRWVGLRRPLRVFISHTGGPDGSQKNFSIWLNDTMTKWRWSKFRFRVKVFFDRVDCGMGEGFADVIFRELERFDVGIVVVTREYFERKWPMTELIAFVEAQQNQPEVIGRSRVLPLFYELTPAEVKWHLHAGTWEGGWIEMTRGRHPLTVQRCTEAVTWLCTRRGLLYDAERRDHDQEYARRVCEAVDAILCKERSWRSDFWWAMPACFQRCRRTPVKRRAMPR